LALDAALDQLQDENADVYNMLLLRNRENCTLREIGAIFQLAPNSVLYRLNAAYDRLRVLLEGQR
jgi:DNA-directed RNA polymerase specialized sigma24 family protein